jgi:transposase
MRRLEIKETDIMQFAVQQEILSSEESRYDHRLHGILLICNGFSCNEVAELFGHSSRTVQYWVYRFEESGFAGLEETPPPGAVYA